MQRLPLFVDIIDLLFNNCICHHAFIFPLLDSNQLSSVLFPRMLCIEARTKIDLRTESVS